MTTFDDMAILLDTIGEEVAQLNSMKPSKRGRSKSKYGNKKVIIDGITFDSKLEGKAYQRLTYLQQAGHISDLVLQPKFILQDKFTDAFGNKHRAITYVADFSYTDLDTGERVIRDVKGMRTAVFNLKEKLFLRLYSQDFDKWVVG